VTNAGLFYINDLGPLVQETKPLAKTVDHFKRYGMSLSAVRYAFFRAIGVGRRNGLLFYREFRRMGFTKVENGYHAFLTNMPKRHCEFGASDTKSSFYCDGVQERSLISGEKGVKRAKWLQEIFHREASTSCNRSGMDHKATMESGFFLLDIPGLNYRVHLYDEASKNFRKDLF
jgi:beta-galactosidase